MNGNGRNDDEDTESTKNSEMEPIVNGNAEDDRCSIGNASFHGGVLDDFVTDDDEEEVSKRGRKRPWLSGVCILIVIVCIVTLAVGLYVGLTRNRTELEEPDKRNEGGIEPEESSPNESPYNDSGDKNETLGPNETEGAKETEGPNEKEGTNETESTNEGDTIVIAMRSINAAGMIRNGNFKALESHPLPNATIPVFGQSSMKKYSGCQALEDDLYNSLSIIINEEILARAASESSPYYMMNEDMMPTMEVGATSQTEPEDSYETNNQVYGIDEADVVKSTAEYVFAAYGDKLILWNATSGEKYSETKLMKLKKPSTGKMIAPMGQSVRVRSLLLHENRLAVIVDGLDEKKGLKEFRVFHGYQTPTRSRVLVYDISKIPTDGSKLPLMAARDLGGSYNDARLIGSVVHLVSMTNVDTYTHLRKRFSRAEKRFAGLNSTEYVANATEYATTTIIPSFIERLKDEILARDIGCEDIMKISMLRTSSEDESVPEVGPLLDGYVQVDSFDILKVPDTTQVVSLSANVTGSFTPSSDDATLYASGDTLVLANKGYRYDSGTKDWKQNTFIMTFTYDGENGVGVNPQGSAEVSGYIMNQYSLDIWDGYLRMASTISSRWGCQANDDEENTCIWTMLEDSNNFVSIYKLPNDDTTSDLNLVGFLDNLGEIGERIEAVRFMGDKAFIVTFLRTDPFYTIDLTNASSPQIHGELKITGFSNYLHPYDEEGDFIIGIGQDANQEGMQTGLQISLFNATDLSNTTLVHRYNVKESLQLFSSSAAQYDPKAFRFLPISKKLIIPSRIGTPSSDDFFDGFLVFDVSPYGIEYSFNVSHVVDIGSNEKAKAGIEYKPNEIPVVEIGSNEEAEATDNVVDWCWYHAYLKPRSLVHKGVLTTIKGHTVLATDLFTRLRQWQLNLDSENKDCSVDGYLSI